MFSKAGDWHLYLDTQSLMLVTMNSTTKHKGSSNAFPDAMFCEGICCKVQAGSSVQHTFANGAPVNTYLTPQCEQEFAR